MSSDRPIVLDTHIWLDVGLGRGRFSPRVRRLIERAAGNAELYVASITPWEVAMLARDGRVRVRGPLLAWLTETLAATHTAVASLNVAISVDAVELPAWRHGDPADRLIVATARHLGAQLITRDGAILDYAAASKAVRALEPGE